MDVAQELTRVRAGEPGSPPGEFDRVAAPGADLDRAREVMVLVLEHSTGEWPSLERWMEVLPAWFVDACLDDALVQSCILDRWSLRGWLHWLRPENRKWYWWGARVEGEQAVVTVLVPERPYLRGALDWLLKTAGATEVSRA